MAAFYVTLASAIVSERGIPVPYGKTGYYFLATHHVSMWQLTDRLAEALHARGLVDADKADVWASHEKAAEVLGLPLDDVASTFDSG